MKNNIIKKMSSTSLETSFKFKIESTNIFDDKFLNEKDFALQPINYLLEAENLLNNENDINRLKNKNLSLQKKDKFKRKSLKESDLYDSNIIIVQELEDEDSDSSSSDQLQKEIKKLIKMLRKSKGKKNNSQSKKISTNSAKF